MFIDGVASINYFHKNGPHIYFKSEKGTKAVLINSKPKQITLILSVMNENAADSTLNKLNTNGSFLGK